LREQSVEGAIAKRALQRQYAGRAEGRRIGGGEAAPRNRGLICLNLLPGFLRLRGWFSGLRWRLVGFSRWSLPIHAAPRNRMTTKPRRVDAAARNGTWFPRRWMCAIRRRLDLLVNLTRALVIGD
jgi:hypothetical protein